MLTKENKLESALIKTVNGKLGAAITPSGINGNDQLIMVNASQWTLPAGLPLLIDKANLEMYLKGNRLTIPNIDIALYDGKLTGDAVMSWPVSKGKVNWKVNGSFRMDNIAVQQPSRMVSKAV